MTPAPSTSNSPRRRLLASVSTSLLACLLGSAWSAPSVAQNPVPPRVVTAASKAPAEQGVRWQDLKPGQQAALRPLERDWTQIAASHKQKWLELSARFPTMTPAEQARVQERMSEWARLTPQQRGQARLHFQEAKQLPAEDRQARWNAYQALSPEQKQQLAARAAPPNAAADAARKSGPAGARSDKTPRDLPQAKSNIVPNPSLVAPPKAIAPAVVQARPGATTTPITKRPTPPLHQQTGMPKIAATPEFVNKATLLPQRGPQGAATGPANIPAPERPPRQ